MTKHLDMRQKAGLVGSTRRGRESLWHLQRQRLAEAQARFDARSRDRDHRISRLRALADGRRGGGYSPNLMHWGTLAQPACGGLLAPMVRGDCGFED